MAVFDLHVHTHKYSDCSFISPEELIGQALEAGLNGLALTEHGMRWPDKEFEKLKKTASSQGIVLINGQEIFAAGSSGETEGEFLVFGVKHSLTKRQTASELCETVHAAGGILIAAHPYKLSRGGKSHYYGAGDRVYSLAIDAIELYHPDHSERATGKVIKAMKELKIPGTGGSDAHKIFNVGSCVTVFENNISNEDDFLREIRRGNIRAEKRK